jgi:hypothetical protein
VGRIFIKCLVVLNLIFGVSPVSMVVFYELNERSTDSETPLEREEAATRSGGSRSASKRSGNYRATDFPVRFIIIGASAQTVSSPMLPPGPSIGSATHLRQLYGVLRI